MAMVTLIAVLGQVKVEYVATKTEKNLPEPRDKNSIGPKIHVYPA
jgi:hypothetical protein